MFRKIPKTKNPPKDKPILLWDGSCGFCKYWYLYLKSKIGDRVDYEPYQEAHDRFEEISFEEFEKASRFIEQDGTVHNGPDSLYRSMVYFRKPVRFFHRLYTRSPLFSRLSDHGYHWVSRHRPALYKLTVAMLGKDPAHLKHYWALWLASPVVLVGLGAALLKAKKG